MSVRLGCWEDKQGRPGVVSSQVPANVSDDHIRMRGMWMFFMKTVYNNCIFLDFFKYRSFFLDLDFFVFHFLLELLVSNKFGFWTIVSKNKFVEMLKLRNRMGKMAEETDRGLPREVNSSSHRPHLNSRNLTRN